MEIILRQAIENLGKPGDVVAVKNGYARNFLLPRGFAYEATPGNLKRIAQERGRLEAAENERRESAGDLAKRLDWLVQIDEPLLDVEALRLELLGDVR